MTHLILALLVTPYDVPYAPKYEPPQECRTFLGLPCHEPFDYDEPGGGDPRGIQTAPPQGCTFLYVPGQVIALGKPEKECG